MISFKAIRARHPECTEETAAIRHRERELTRLPLRRIAGHRAFRLSLAVVITWASISIIAATTLAFAKQRELKREMKSSNVRLASTLPLTRNNDGGNLRPAIVTAQVLLPIIIMDEAKGARTFYVAPTGSDTNDGTLARPWKTPHHAAQAAPPGAIIYLRSGTYPGFEVARSGLTFGEYSGETAIVSGSIQVKGVTNTTIRDLTVQGVLTTKEAGLLVKDSSEVLITDNLIRGNSFGLQLSRTHSVVVESNKITDNASGIEVHYEGEGNLIRNNQIFENTRYLDASRSATGINFYYTTGHITFSDNKVWGHQTPDFSSGLGIEIYAASNITMTRNEFWDNGDLVETGTKGGLPCNNLTFTRNVAYKSGPAVQQGLILRCASNSLIAHNTFDGLDKFVFTLSHQHGTYGASIEGLRIVNNIAVNGRVYSIETALPQSVVIDYNLAYNPGSDALYGKYIAYVSDKGNTASFGEFQAWTGYEAHGVNANPKFVDRATRDYQLAGDSPAIDRGIPIDQEYRGSAPDLGSREH